MHLLSQTSVLVLESTGASYNLNAENSIARLQLCYVGSTVRTVSYWSLGDKGTTFDVDIELGVQKESWMCFLEYVSVSIVEIQLLKYALQFKHAAA